MARPIIATDVPGCRSVVDDGTTGFLCEVRSGESLAATCERFMTLSVDQRAALGRVGRAKMEKGFGQSVVIDAYRAALADLTPSMSRVAA